LRHLQPRLIADKRLSHPFFDPLYAEAEKANLPFCVHASTGNFDWVDLFDGKAVSAGSRCRCFPLFHSIVHDGIPQKFPALRFGFIEVRAQWVPYLCIEIARRFERSEERREKNIYSR